jgi:hypothetical protein
VFIEHFVETLAIRFCNSKEKKPKSLRNITLAIFTWIWRICIHLLYRRNGEVKKELGLKTPFQAVEKCFMLKPEIFKQNTYEFKNKILHLQPNKSLNNLVKLDKY